MTTEGPESGETPPSTDSLTPAQTPEACSRVFVSYASVDAAVASALVEALERHGVVCWIAPRDVKAGALYAEAIVRAISDAKALVLVLSANSVASAHVGKEVERASSKRRPVIALRIDDAPLSPALEYFLSESHWIDARAGGMDAALVKLITAIREPDAPAITSLATPVTSGTTASAAHPKSRNRIVFAIGLAVVVVAAAALLVNKFWLSNRAKTAQAVIPATSGLAAATPAVPAISDRSIAVLPFTDMSEKHDQQYFADGIAEEVLDRLAKVPGLKVVGRTSSFQFNGKSADLASVGTALGVAYLLEGSVRKDADRVRVTAQLVEARTGSQRWSDRFDSDLVDVLNVQDTIAIEIARALQIAVEADTVPRSSVKSPQVLEAYLRGLEYENRQSRESSEAAVADYQQALTLDPAFAPAAIGIARVESFIGAEGWLPTRTAFERAREAAQLAQRLTPRSPEPHVLMARIHTYHDWDWAGADQELQQAFALGPRDTYGAQTACQLAAARGQWDEARQLAIDALERDPLSPDAHMFLGWNVYLHTGQLSEAEQSFRRGLRIAPKWGSGQYFLGEALMLQGHLDAALVEFQKETADDGRLEGSAMALFAAGRKAESDSLLAEAIRRNGTSWPSETARTYAFRGEKDRAFEWLDRAYELRDPDIYTFKGDPLFKNLENDPRYKAFLRKMNLPE
jgi:TolB-like protein/tetratricopeptide (TPR) repeat protein